MRPIFQICVGVVLLVTVVSAGITFGPMLPGVKGHEEFAGALIGAAGTVFAGLIAWVAVQYQIENDRQLAKARENGTYQVICKEFRPYVDLYCQVWRIVENSIPGDAEMRQDGINLIKAFSIRVGVEDCVRRIENLANDLDPVRKNRLVDVIQTFKMLDQMLNRAPDSEGDRYWLLNTRTMLSHFDRQLSEFDPVAARRFNSFIKSPLDYRSGAEHVETLVDEFIARGKLS